MRFSLGDVGVDLGTRQVWRGDIEVHLTRRAFELLALLIERRPNAVSKPEIHTRLWPDTFVSEVTLQGLVFEIREAIGDRARKPRFIRTVHGFGYALSGPVSEASGTEQPSRRVRGWLIGEPGRLPLFDGDNVLGREGPDVIELASPTVSRRHASITFGDPPMLEDLGSKNGTFLGDTPVTKRVPVADGDRLRLGSVLLTFRLGPTEEDSTQTVTPSSPPQRRG
jgi:DNA-binding winged helix-turn-helix (wHTH) protein